MEKKRPQLTKPAGCFVQLVGAVVVIVGLGQFIEDPPRVVGGICYLALGGAILLLGRKTR